MIFLYSPGINAFSADVYLRSCGVSSLAEFYREVRPCLRWRGARLSRPLIITAASTTAADLFERRSYIHDEKYSITAISQRTADLPEGVLYGRDRCLRDSPNGVDTSTSSIQAARLARRDPKVLASK